MQSTVETLYLFEGLPIAAHGVILWYRHDGVKMRYHFLKFGPILRPGCLMTYDRAIVKFDVDKMAQIHRRLH